MGRGSKGPKRSSQPLLSSRIGLISLSPHTVIKGFKCPHLSDLSKQYYQGTGTPGLCTQSISLQHSGTLSWLLRAAVPRHSLPCRPLRCQSEGPPQNCTLRGTQVFSYPEQAHPASTIGQGSRDIPKAWAFPMGTGLSAECWARCFHVSCVTAGYTHPSQRLP